MKIYDILQHPQSDISFGAVPDGGVFQTHSGDLWMAIPRGYAECKVGRRWAVRMECGTMMSFEISETAFTLRPDIVLTTDCNLRNKPE